MQILSAYLNAASSAYGHLRRNILTADQKNMTNWTKVGNLVVEYDADENLTVVTIPQEAGQYQAPDGNYYKYHYVTTITGGVTQYYDEVHAFSNKPIAYQKFSGGNAYFYSKGSEYDILSLTCQRNDDHHYYGADIWLGLYKQGSMVELPLNVALWNNGNSSYASTTIPAITIGYGDDAAERARKTRVYLQGLTERTLYLQVSNIMYGEAYEFMFDMCTTSGASYYVGADTTQGVLLSSTEYAQDAMALPITESSQLVEYSLVVEETQYDRLGIKFTFSELNNNNGNVVFEIANLRLYKGLE